MVEVSCGECHDSRLVAFSCKGRGWCPSCTTRRALEGRLVKAVWLLQRAKARTLGREGRLHGGGVCFWQWLGSSRQLTPHLRLFLPECCRASCPGRAGLATVRVTSGRSLELGA